ncbi:mRNA-decapping enzyme-like protein [Rhynchospora pubera]|uniref:mRNA-decapping enzyme-like protein n=1 Tax=Rhynchospora pubera TaxID=906938 RepID=A0AAV8EMB7_9POAL|nr:mRNA-decapping enzyme-like protein [Rhynchospora pubera]
MAQRRVQLPNPEMTREEENVTRNLSVLQRHDPLIEEILVTASHVILYQNDYEKSLEIFQKNDKPLENYEWKKKVMEGPFFVVKRNAASKFYFIIMNRSNPENFVDDISEICEYYARPPCILYQKKDKVVRCIRFNDSRICKNTLERILFAFGKASPNLKSSPIKSKVEKLDLESTSNFRDGFVFPNPPPPTSAHVQKNHEKLVKENNFAYRRPDSSKFVPVNPASFPIQNSDPSQIKSSTTPATGMSKMSFKDMFVLPNPPPTMTHFQNYHEKLVKQGNFAYINPDFSEFAPFNPTFNSVISKSEPSQITNSTTTATRLAMQDDYAEDDCFFELFCCNINMVRHVWSGTR